MAAKTSPKSDPTFAAAIARVQPALTAWRERRKHRESIPEDLWQRMVPLARHYGLSPVVQALRVNYNGLKRRLAARPPPEVSGADSVPAGFVEVPMTACPSGSQLVIELEERNGSKLTLRLAQTDSALALALAQGLWRQRS